MAFEDQIIKILSVSKDTNRVNIKVENRLNLSETFYTKKDDRYKFIQHRINSLKKSYAEILEIEDFKPVNYKSDTSFNTIGVIIKGSNPKDRKSQALICSLIDDSNGVMLKLDLSYLKHYSIFPGQIVAITGKNVKGDEIVVQKIHTLPVFDYNSSAPDVYRKYSDIYKDKSLQIEIISGPYSGDGDFIFLDKLFERSPDLFILIGPFLDSFNQNNDLNEVFSSIILPKIEKWLLKSMSSKIIIIPSTLDLNTLGIFPQEKFNYGINNERIVFLSNPTLFKINEMSFGCCSFDNLFHLGKEEICYENKDFKAWKEDESSAILFKNDRLGRLCTHLVFQQSFMPVFPIKEVVDFSWPSNFDIPEVPDFFINCSLFKEFHKRIGPTTVINVGMQRAIGNKLLVVLEISAATEKLPDDENWVGDRTKIEIINLL